MFWNKINLSVITQFCINKVTLVGNQSQKFFLTIVFWLTHSLTLLTSSLRPGHSWDWPPGRSIFHSPNQKLYSSTVVLVCNHRARDPEAWQLDCCLGYIVRSSLKNVKQSPKIDTSIPGNQHHILATMITTLGATPVCMHAKQTYT